MEHGERHEARLVVAVDHNLDQFEGIFDQVGNHEGVLGEETEICVGSPFGGPKLKIRYKR